MGPLLGKDLRGSFFYVNFAIRIDFILPMSRILAVDFGLQRSGLAVTDPLQIIVTALDTVETRQLVAYITDYCQREIVEKIVFGKPVHRDGQETYLMPYILQTELELKRKIPGLHTAFQDESGTSAEARGIIFNSGIGKEKRKDKARIDRVSAVLILQKYLGHI